MPSVRFSAASDLGGVRAVNEDAYFADAEVGLWLVADGMGGHNAGDVASALVVETAAASFQEDCDLSRALQAAHRAVQQASREDEANAGMGSTAVALTFEGDHYHAGWVGDSRIYLWDRSLKLLSRDHSVVLDMLDRGLITADEVAHHPCSNMITQALGLADLEQVKVDTVTGPLHPGQQFLLCSDGLTSEVADAQIAEILAAGGSEEEKVERLIQAALANGGNDNVTVIVVSAPEEPVTGDVATMVRPATADPDVTELRPGTPHKPNPRNLAWILAAALALGMLILVLLARY